MTREELCIRLASYSLRLYSCIFKAGTNGMQRSQYDFDKHNARSGRTAQGSKHSRRRKVVADAAPQMLLELKTRSQLIKL